MVYEPDLSATLAPTISTVIQHWPIGSLCLAQLAAAAAVVGLVQFWAISQFVDRVHPAGPAATASPVMHAGGSH